jgi:probable HAF family extracellular repeat protein
MMMNMKRSNTDIRSALLLVAASVALAVASGARAQCGYEVTATFLGPNTPYGPAHITVWALNEQSVLVGGYRITNGPDKPYVWEDGQLMTIDLPDGFVGGDCADINEGRQIVGMMYGDDIHARGFLIDGDDIINLGVLPGGNSSRAEGINAFRQVTGYWGNNITGPWQAFLWEDDVMTDLGPSLGAEYSRAYDINDAGQIVGWRQMTDDPVWIGFLWQDGEVTDLGPIPGGFTSQARALNEIGQVVGKGRVYDPDPPGWKWRGFFWSDGQMTDLGILPGFDETIPWDINNSGHVVGYCYAKYACDTAFLWRDGVMIDLNDLIPPDSGVTMIGGKSIANNGQIAAWGVDQDWNSIGILLSPIYTQSADINADGRVNIHDLFAVLGAWGDCDDPPADCPADLNCDGIVNLKDIMRVIENWGKDTW